MSSWRVNWVSEKCQLAMRLSRGEAGGSYAEAALVACSVLSALAAEIWPGTKIDRVRFIELLATHGPEASTCRMISVPLLAQELATSGKLVEAEALRRAFGVPQISRVLTGPEVDRGESEILALCPSLNLEMLRRFSYASILYSEIRSSYAHQYQPGERTDSLPMTMLEGQKISYINRICDDLQSRRLLHFHIEWLLELPIELARVTDLLASNLPKTMPSTWWAKGA